MHHDMIRHHEKWTILLCRLSTWRSSVNLIKLGFHCQPPKRLWYQKSRSIVAISSVRKQLEFSSNKTRSLWFSVCTFAVRAQYGNIFRNWTLVSEREKGCIPDELTQCWYQQPKEQPNFGEWKRKKLFSFFFFFFSISATIWLPICTRTSPTWVFNWQSDCFEYWTWSSWDCFFFPSNLGKWRRLLHTLLSFQFKNVYLIWKHTDRKQ